MTLVCLAGKSTMFSLPFRASLSFFFPMEQQRPQRPQSFRAFVGSVLRGRCGGVCGCVLCRVGASESV